MISHINETESYEILCDIFTKDIIHKMGDKVIEMIHSYDEDTFKNIKFEFIHNPDGMYTNNYYRFKVGYDSYGHEIPSNTSSNLIKVRFEIEIDPRGLYCNEYDFKDSEPYTSMDYEWIRDLMTPDSMMYLIKFQITKSLNPTNTIINKGLNRFYPIHKRELFWDLMTRKHPQLYPELEKIMPEYYAKKYKHLKSAHKFGFFDE